MAHRALPTSRTFFLSPLILKADSCLRLRQFASGPIRRTRIRLRTGLCTGLSSNSVNCVFPDQPGRPVPVHLGRSRRVPGPPGVRLHRRPSRVRGSDRVERGRYPTLSLLSIKDRSSRTIDLDLETILLLYSGLLIRSPWSNSSRSEHAPDMRLGPGSPFSAFGTLGVDRESPMRQNGKLCPESLLRVSGRIDSWSASIRNRRSNRSPAGPAAQGTGSRP